MDLKPRIVSEKMSLPFRIILLVTSLSTIVLCQKSQIRIDPDGGYTGIVIKIDKDVPEDLCPEILTNLKVRKFFFTFSLFLFFRQRSFVRSPYRYHLLSVCCLSFVVFHLVFNQLFEQYQTVARQSSGCCQAVH